MEFLLLNMASLSDSLFFQIDNHEIVEKENDSDKLMATFLRDTRFLTMFGVILMLTTIVPLNSSFQVFQPAYATVPNIQVFVGYADSLRPGALNFPNPWQGSPNFNFIGSNPQWDAGAIRIDNLGSTPIIIDSVVVDLNRPGPVNNLWGSFTIPAHQGVILTQTTQFNFDTSDFPFKSCGQPATPADGHVPTITITSGANSQTFTDNGHVLDTLGFDLACIHNESTPWTPVGGATLTYSEALFVNGNPLVGPVNPGQTLTEIASSTDLTINSLTFHWKDPSGNEVRTQTTTTVFTDSFNPTTVGNWNVCVDFVSGTTLVKNICSPFAVGTTTPVGGVIVPTDMTALFVAGAMVNASWLLLALGGVLGASLAFFKIRR